MSIFKINDIDKCFMEYVVCNIIDFIRKIEATSKKKFRFMGTNIYIVNKYYYNLSKPILKAINVIYNDINYDYINDFMLFLCKHNYYDIIEIYFRIRNYRHHYDAFWWSCYYGNIKLVKLLFMYENNNVAIIIHNNYQIIDSMFNSSNDWIKNIEGKIEVIKYLINICREKNVPINNEIKLYFYKKITNIIFDKTILEKFDFLINN
jgi:hypothetical protein